MEHHSIDWPAVERQLWTLRQQVTAQLHVEAFPIETTLGWTPDQFIAQVCGAILTNAARYQYTHEIILEGDPFAGPVHAFLLPDEQTKEDAMTRQLQEVLGDAVEIAPPTAGDLPIDGDLKWLFRVSTFELWVSVQYSVLVID
jgi:hypothetical protein